MSEMLDWWTVRGERFGIQNYDFKIELTPDPSMGLEESDIFDDDTIRAYRDRDWRYVVVKVVPTDRELTDQPGCAASLNAVEWGDLPGLRIDRDAIVEHPVRDLLYEVIGRLISAGFEVAAEEGCPYLQPAPF